MAREFYLAGVPAEELQPAPPPPPLTPQQKRQNFWYHYKWVVLAAVAGALVLGFLIWQLATRTKYDYQAVLVTDRALSSAATKALTAELEALAADVNGDGEVHVNVENLVVSADIRLVQISNTSRAKVMSYLAAGDVMLFGFSPSYYQDLCAALELQSSFFCELPGAGETGDGTYWDWIGSTLHALPELENAPEHLYFGVRNASGTAKESGDTQAQCVQLLQALIAQRGALAADTVLYQKEGGSALPERLTGDDAAFVRTLLQNAAWEPDDDATRHESACFRTADGTARYDAESGIFFDAAGRRCFALSAAERARMRTLLGLPEESAYDPYVTAEDPQLREELLPLYREAVDCVIARREQVSGFACEQDAVDVWVALRTCFDPAEALLHSYKTCDGEPDGEPYAYENGVLTLRFRYEPAEHERLYRAYVQPLEEALALLTDQSETEKMRALYWYVSGYLRYEPAEDRFSAIAQGRGICNEYAHMLCLLARQAGMQALELYSDGLAVDHAWTAVRTDGKWHHFDACWQSTSFVPSGAEGQEFFFAMSDAYRLETLHATETVTLHTRSGAACPVCDDTGFDETCRANRRRLEDQMAGA